MPKISIFAGTKGLFIKYFVKAIVSSVFIVLFCSGVLSVIVLKLDLDLSFIKYLSIAISIIIGFLVPYISISSFKNNYLPLAILSVIPYIIYLLINMLINNNYTYGIIYIVVTIMISIFTAVLKSSKNR